MPRDSISRDLMQRFWVLNFLWPLLLAGFGVWVFLTQDMAAAVRSLARSDWPMAVLALGINLFLLYVRVFNWSVILRPVWRPLSSHGLCLPAFTAYLINSIFPGRIGGLVQAWLAGKRTGMGLGRAFGSVLIIRIMDGVILVALMVLLLALVPEQGGLSRILPAAVVLGAGAAGLATGAWVLVKHPAQQKKLIRWLVFLVPQKFKAGGQETLAGFMAGLALFKHPLLLVGVLGGSACFWAGAGVSVFCLFQAFHPDQALWSRAYVLLGAQVFAMAVPAPGNVGPYHGATIAVLHHYGIPMGQALMTAVAMHGIMTLGNCLPGLAYLMFDRASVGKIFRRVKKGGLLD